MGERSAASLMAANPSSTAHHRVLMADGGYFADFAFSAFTLAHRALTAARMLALPSADIFRFFGAGAGAGAAPDLLFAQRFFAPAIILAFASGLIFRFCFCGSA